MLLDVKNLSSQAVADAGQAFLCWLSFHEEDKDDKLNDLISRYWAGINAHHTRVHIRRAAILDALHRYQKLFETAVRNKSSSL